MPIAEKVVVAVALMRDGEVLSARRSYPPAVAGQWELPGGKVDDGESPAEAAIRECREELGCEIRPLGPLTASVLLRPGLRLIAEYAEIVSGTPEAREHSDLRWLGPEELDDVEWIGADREFLPELRERLLDGAVLAGGATGGAVRIGSTVRRTTGPWTPVVHELLAHLRALPVTPDVLGIDERGREVLTYLPGSTVRPDTETLSDAQVASCGHALRAIHDQLATFRPDGERRWRYGPRALQPGEVICHNDPGVYNWAFDGDEAAGLFDWDMAGPGDPMDDLGFLAWTAIPLYRDLEPGDVARRLGVLTAAYDALPAAPATDHPSADPAGDEPSAEPLRDQPSVAAPGDGDSDCGVAAALSTNGITPLDVLHAAHRRMNLACERIAAGIERGDPGMANLAKVGEPQRTRDRLTLLESHLDAITDVLQAHPGGPSPGRREEPSLG